MSAMESGIAGQNITIMIPMATAIETADWIPRVRVSAARARSVSSSSVATAPAVVARALPAATAPPVAAARASAAWRAPGRTS